MLIVLLIFVLTFYENLIALNIFQSNAFIFNMVLISYKREYNNLINVAYRVEFHHVLGLFN